MRLLRSTVLESKTETVNKSMHGFYWTGQICSEEGTGREKHYMKYGYITENRCLEFHEEKKIIRKYKRSLGFSEKNNMETERKYLL